MYRLWDNIGIILILKLFLVRGQKTLRTVFGIHHRFKVCANQQKNLFTPMKLDPLKYVQLSPVYVIEERSLVIYSVSQDTICCGAGEGFDVWTNKTWLNRNYSEVQEHFALPWEKPQSGRNKSI